MQRSFRDSPTDIVIGCKMQARTAYTEQHDQVAGIGFRNVHRVWAQQKIVENNGTKILWDFQIHLGRYWPINQLHGVVEGQKTAVVLDVVVSSTNNIRMEYEKLEKVPKE